jgi:hypothetical protein
MAAKKPLVDALNAESPELEALRVANIRLQRQLASATAKTEQLVTAVYRAAYDAAVTIGHPPPVKMRASATTSTLEPHVALLHTTDWQGGKKTADYDLDVLERRLVTMFDKTVLLADRHGHPVQSLVLMFGGDDIEGVSIFPTQPFEIHAGLYEQLFAVVRLKRMLVDMALSRFEHVYVRRKWGNHGRIGKFGELPDVDNLDLIADTFASEAYRDNPRVTWASDDLSYIQQFEIGNYRAALLHGNEFYRSFSAQRIVNKVTAWQTIYGFGDVYMGHFHRSDVYSLPNGSKVYMTGSPESSNSYAADHLAAQSVPSQRLHFIDPEAGRVQAEHILQLV